MKKTVVLMLCGTIILSMLSGCASQPENKRKPKYNTETDSPYKTVTSEKQNFSTKCLKAYKEKWKDDVGLHIYTENEDSVPYVLIWRFENTTDAKQQLTIIREEMTEQYGADMIEVGPIKDYTVGGKTIPGILFTYKSGDYTLHSLRLEYAIGNDIINFTAKYIDGDDDLTMRALDVAVENFTNGIPDPSDKQQKPKNKQSGDVVITPSDNASVSYVKYTEENGYFSMDIPKGWKVTIGLPPEYGVDLISYAVTVYDPANTDRKLYFNLNCVCGLQSEAAREWYNTWYPNTFGSLPALKEISAKGFFSAMGQYYGYSNFSVTENIGKTNLNCELLSAGAVSSASGKPIRGLFSAMVDAMSEVVLKNPLDYTSGTVDVGLVNAYTVVYETAPENEFIDWLPVLDHCFASLTFSDRFQSERAQQWKAVMGTSSYIFNTSNEISNMIMDTWEQRNTSYDVISQKQSDATLGYDRVLDKETGKYYRADAGFGDVFKDDRYVVVDDDAAYLTPSSGWIEWKK